MNTLSALINATSKILVNCQVRLAANSDEAALKAFLRFHRASFQHLIISDPDVDLSAIEAFYNNRDGFILLLEREGRIVGSIALFALDESRCEIRKFYLAKELTSLGLGRKLLTSVMQVAEARGFRTVQVETLPFLVSAYALYAKFGYRRSKSAIAPHVTDGHILERALASSGEKNERAC